MNIETILKEAIADNKLGYVERTSLEGGQVEYTMFLMYNGMPILETGSVELDNLRIDVIRHILSLGIQKLKEDVKSRVNI